MKKTLLVILLLCINYTLTFASIWRVNNVPGVEADFKTLQGAIDTAQAGDTLYVEGTQFDYTCDTIYKKLVIYGPGYFLDENDTTSYYTHPAVVKGINAHIRIVDAAAHTKIYGLYFIPGSKFHILADHVTIANNYFVLPNLDRLNVGDNVQNTYLKCNYIAGTIDLNNSLNSMIKNNIITSGIRMNNDGSAIIYNNVVQSFAVNNSEIKNNIQYREGNNSGNMGTNNVIEHNVLCGNWASSLPNNVILTDNSSIFLEDNPGSSNGTEYSTDGRYRLASGSPATGAGENGVDCGAYGAATPYKLSGLPPVPRIYEASIPASASEESGLPVKVKIKTK